MKGKRKSQLGLFEAADAPPPPKRDAARPRPSPAHQPPAATASEPSPSRAARRADRPPERRVLTVEELARLLTQTLERATVGLLVEGEVTGLKRAGSGITYFNLKDPRTGATLDAVVYRSAPPRIRQQLREGERVVLAGRATLYAQRGRLQFAVTDVLQTARGALLEQRARVKAALEAEGLFAPARKRALPERRRWVAVITSRSGAAIHDFVKVAHRRGALRITLVHAAVQGQGAARQLAAAVHYADRLGFDVLVLTRGGGSADDLAAFDDPQLVRAVAAVRTPIISAVGHEVDVSLCDLAADARAATPSQAAEMLVPDEAARLQRLRGLAGRLQRAHRHHLAAHRQRLDGVTQALVATRRSQAAAGQALDERRDRLERALRARLRAHAQGLRASRTRLEPQSPQRRLAEVRRRLDAHAPRLTQALRSRLQRLKQALPRELETVLRPQLHARREIMADLELRLGRVLERSLQQRRQGIASSAAQLHALSPLAVLDRGYSIVRGAEGVVRDGETLNPGQRLELRFHRGRATAEVIEVAPLSTDPTPSE